MPSPSPTSPRRWEVGTRTSVRENRGRRCARWPSGSRTSVIVRPLDRARDEEHRRRSPRIGVVPGAAHHGHEVGPVALPSGRVGDPLLLPVDDPVPAVAAGRGPQPHLHPRAGIGLVEVGGAAGLGQGEGGERGPGRRQERCEELPVLRRGAGPQQGGQPEPGREQVQGHARVAGDQLLGQHRGRGRPGPVPAEGLRDEPAQEPGLHHLPVEGAGGPVALGGCGQGVGDVADVGEDVAGELARLGAQGLLLGADGVGDGHGAFLPVLSGPRTGRRRRAGSRPSRTPRPRDRGRRGRSPRSRPCGPPGAARRRRRMPRRGAWGS